MFFFFFNEPEENDTNIYSSVSDAILVIMRDMMEKLWKGF